MKLARDIDESASDVVGYVVFPRPADCGMVVDGVAFQEKTGLLAQMSSGPCRVEQNARCVAH